MTHASKLGWGAAAALAVALSGYLVFGRITGDGLLGFTNLEATNYVSGSGAANQVAYFDGTASVAGDTDFTVNAGTGVMTVTGFVVTNATSTNATSTALFATNFRGTSSTITTLAAGAFNANTLVATNATATSIFVTSFQGTSGTADTLNVGTLSVASCTGCSGGIGSAGQFQLAIYNGASALGGVSTLTANTSTNVLTADGWTVSSTSSTFVYATATNMLAWLNATGTNTYLFALNVSGTLDTKAGVVTCGNVNCLKTVVLSAAGCNVPTPAGAGTSTLIYTGNNVERGVYFQPLAYSRCQADWFVPDSWDGGTLSASFIYAVTTTDNNGVTWGVQGEGMGDGGAFTTAFSGATATVTLVATTTNAFTVSTATTLTVGGLTADPTVLRLQITRSNVGASTNTAALIGVRLEYRVTGLND